MVKDLKSEDMAMFQSSNSSTFVATRGARQSIRDIAYVGIEDESIQQYKERLLGNLSGVTKNSIRATSEIDKPFVEIVKLEMVTPERPEGNIDLTLVTNAEGVKKVQNIYTLKEGSTNQLKIVFKVHNDIVLGLKIATHAKAGPMRQSSDEC